MSKDSSGAAALNSKPQTALTRGLGTRSKRAFIGGPTVAAAVVRFLARTTPYVEDELVGLAQLVRAGDVCIDIGAAAGLYSLELSELTGSKGRVLSVEPLPFAHKIWSRLLGVNSRQNVQNYQLALGDERCDSSISVPVGRFGPVTGRSFLMLHSNGLGSNEEFKGHMNVETRVDTLDNLCATEHIAHVDFIKIDVEGAELQVLKGAHRILAQFTPTLLLEIEDRHLQRFGYSANDVTSWLSQYGYKMYVWDGGWRLAHEIETRHRNYLFCI
jgi:FkbM family methyltransferase